VSRCIDEDTSGARGTPMIGLVRSPRPDPWAISKNSGPTTKK